MITTDESFAGLPFRSIIGRYADRFPASSAHAQNEFDAASAWASEYGVTWTGYFLASATGSFTPSTILWSRLVANMIVTTLVAFAALAAVSACRTARRAARGRCTECGFDLRGLSGIRCPECGFDAVLHA